MADFTQALKSYFSAGGVLMLPLAVLAFFLYYLSFDLLFYLKAISKKISSQQFILESLNLPLAPCSAVDLKAAFNNFRMQIMPQTAQTATMIAVLAAAAPLFAGRVGNGCRGHIARINYHAVRAYDSDSRNGNKNVLPECAPKNSYWNL